MLDFRSEFMTASAIMGRMTIVRCVSLPVKPRLTSSLVGGHHGAHRFVGDHLMKSLRRVIASTVRADREMFIRNSDDRPTIECT